MGLQMVRTAPMQGAQHARQRCNGAIRKQKTWHAHSRSLDWTGCLHATRATLTRCALVAPTAVPRLDISTATHLVSTAIRPLPSA